MYERTELPLEYRTFINSKYNVVGQIYLPDYDRDFTKIDQLLSSIKIDQFLPNDRIVIEHFETDYYLPEFPYGFTLYNLFTAFKKLDIPLFTMLLVTNSFGIEKEVNQLVTDLNDCPTIVSTFLSTRHYIDSYTNISIEAEEITIPGISMLGYARTHRNALFNFINKNNLLNLIATSFRKI